MFEKIFPFHTVLIANVSVVIRRKREAPTCSEFVASVSSKSRGGLHDMIPLRCEGFPCKVIRVASRLQLMKNLP